MLAVAVRPTGRALGAGKDGRAKQLINMQQCTWEHLSCFVFGLYSYSIVGSSMEDQFFSQGKQQTEPVAAVSLILALSC